ncbi:UNKNOWN [Stylonychia lemnae]|uniref:Uncharacterized protein n=1 Tax=Stylonychia lemnae TaxID=5949 RepID=A0A078B1J3_STYLE|nr:UNKNOWN [Stylonychia lemnae]|eukprot:CDW87128.1 UNKNOWN [Stylonychia lemnae]
MIKISNNQLKKMIILLLHIFFFTDSISSLDIFKTLRGLTKILDDEMQMSPILPAQCSHKVYNHEFIEIDHQRLGGDNYHREQTIKKDKILSFKVFGNVNQDIALVRSHVWVFYQQQEVHYKKHLVLKYFYRRDNFYYEMQFELPSYSLPGRYIARLQLNGFTNDRYQYDEQYQSKVTNLKEEYGQEVNNKEDSQQKTSNIKKAQSSQIADRRPRDMEYLTYYDPDLLGCFEFHFDLF